MSERGRPAAAGGGIGRAARGLLALPPGAARVLALGWLVLIFLSSEVPARGGGGTRLTAFVLNLGHAALYGVLAALALAGLPRAARTPITATARWAVVAAVTACGLLDEVHQRLVPGRDFSVLDLVTDAVGAAAAVGLLAHLQRPAGAGADAASGAGLWARVAVAILAAAAAAAAATFLPDSWPRTDWL